MITVCGSSLMSSYRLIVCRCTQHLKLSPEQFWCSSKGSTHNPVHCPYQIGLPKPKTHRMAANTATSPACPDWFHISADISTPHAQCHTATYMSSHFELAYQIWSGLWCISNLQLLVMQAEKSFGAYQTCNCTQLLLCS